MAEAIVAPCLHIISKRAAQSAGLQFFFTGKKCRNGHLAERRTKSGSCRGCEIERHQTTYPFTKSIIAEKRKTVPSYKQGLKTYIEKRQKWRSENPELARELRRNEYLANKDRYRESQARWYAEHKDVAKEIAHRRRARLLGADGSHTPADIRKIFNLQKGKCAHCRASIKAGYHVDHIEPLSMGGSNAPDNLQLLCAPCNLSKGAKDPIEWKRQHGLLL